MLHDLQKNFFVGIFEQGRTILDSIQPEGIITPEQRLQVYRNNVYLILTEHLQNIFPVVFKLVGNRFFQQSAKAFITEQPPSSGDMAFYGENFPKFLNLLPSLSAHPYTSDVAEMEWHYYAAGILPLHPILSSEDFQQELQNNGQIINITFQPHISVLKSPYPVLDIWQHIRNNTEDALDSLNMKQPCHLIIYRNDREVMLLSTDEAVFAFADTIKTGKVAEEALDAALSIDPNFVPAEHLRYFLCNKMLCQPEKEMKTTAKDKKR